MLPKILSESKPGSFQPSNLIIQVKLNSKLSEKLPPRYSLFKLKISLETNSSLDNTKESKWKLNNYIPNL